MSSHPTENVVSRRLLYLRALQTALPSVLEIIDDAPHVAIYRFISDQKQWVRMNVEGSAYITRNAEAPFYSLIVLNKKGEDDFVFHLQKIEKLRMQENYLMLRCYKEPQETEQIIYGIWIHSDAERERIFNSISGVLSKSAASNPSAFLSKLNNLRASPSVVAQPPVPAPTTNSTNIAANQKSLTLLSALKKSQQNNNNGNGNTVSVDSSDSSTFAVNAAEEEKKTSPVSPAMSLNAASALLAAIKPPQNTQTQVISAASNAPGLRANESASIKLLSALKASSINPVEQPPVAPSVNKGTLLLSALKKERESPTNSPAERDLCDLLTDAQIASRVKSQQTPFTQQPPKPPVTGHIPLAQVSSPSVSTQKKEQNMSNLQSPSTASKGERLLNEKRSAPQSSALPSQPSQSAQKDKSTLKALLISPSMLEG